MEPETILQALLQLWDELPDLSGKDWHALFARLEKLRPQLYAAANPDAQSTAAVELIRALAAFPQVSQRFHAMLQAVSEERDTITRKGSGVPEAKAESRLPNWTDLLKELRALVSPPYEIRYTDISAPQRLALGERGHIVVGLTPAPSADSLEAQPLRVRKKESLEVLLHANSADFEVIGGSVKTIEAATEPKIEPVVFQLRGLSLGEKRVNLDFRRAGMVALSVPLTIEVVTGQSQTQQINPIIEFGGPTVPPLDLEIRVRVESGGREISYVLHSPSGAAPFYNLPVQGVSLRTAPEEFQRRTMTELESLMAGKEADGRPLPPARVADRLAGIGRNLYEELFSAELKNHYWRFRDSVRTMLINSDEPWLPWEMIKPYRDDDPSQPTEDNFLCLQYQLTRWLSGSAGPATRFAVKRLAAIEAAAAPGQMPLPYARAEREYLSKLAAAHPGVADESLASATFTALDELLRRGGINLYHFAAHGDFDYGTPGDAQLPLADGQSFRAKDLHGARQTQLAKDRPFVFLNACRVGQQGFSLTQLGGWAAALIQRSRCGGFVGPLWSVNDGRAYRFARAFYQALANSETVGAAAQQARQRIAGTDPTWLAYSLYAHPNARLSFAPEEDG